MRFLTLRKVTDNSCRTFADARTEQVFNKVNHRSVKKERSVTLAYTSVFIYTRRFKEQHKREESTTENSIDTFTGACHLQKRGQIMTNMLTPYTLQRDLSRSLKQNAERLKGHAQEHASGCG